MKKLLILSMNLVIILLLSGCWGKRDIDQMTICVAIGIDKKEDTFEVTAQVMNPFVIGQNPLDQAAVVTISQEGETVFDAIRKMSKVLTGKLFIAHFDVLLFGEDVAKEGLKEYLEFFLSDPESQQKFTVVIVKEDTAKNLLKIQTMLNLIPAISVYQKVRLSEEAYGISYVVYGTEVYSRIIKDEIDNAITGIKIKGDPEKGSKDDNTKSTTPDAVFNSAEIAVLKNGKLIGWLSEEESFGFNHVMGNLKSFVVPVQFNESTKISFEGFKTKVKTKLEMKDNTPKIIVNYQMEGRIGEVMTGEINHSTEYYKNLEDAISTHVKKQMEKAVNKALKEYKSDIFGFGQIIHRKETKYWNKHKENRESILEKLEVEISVKTKITDALK